MARYIEGVERTPTSMTLRVNGLDEDYHLDGRYVVWRYKRAVSGSWSSDTSVPCIIPAYSPYSEDAKFEYLDTNTEYVFEADIYYGDGTLAATVTQLGENGEFESYATMAIPIIDKFIVRNGVSGSLEFSDWEMNLSDIYWGITEWAIWVRQAGNNEWWPKLSGVIDSEGYYEQLPIPVDDFGDFYFKLVVTTKGYSVESSGELIRRVIPLDTDTLNFGLISAEDSKNVTIAWNSEPIYAGKTTYSVDVQKIGEPYLRVADSVVCDKYNECNFTIDEVGDYRVIIYYNYKGFGNVNYFVGTFTIYSEGRPADWDWGTYIQSRTAMDVDEMKAIPYTVWNSFVDRIGEFARYYGNYGSEIGESVYGYPADTSLEVLLEGAKIDSDKTLTADKFNIARYCIGSMNSFNVDVTPNSIKARHDVLGGWDVEPGEVVYGAYFLDLAVWLNGVG